MSDDQPSRRSVLCGLLAAACAGSGPARPGAAELQPWRLGTGGQNGTYYPIGRALAGALTWKGADCSEACGVPGIVVVPQYSNGSVSNVLGLAKGVLEMGIAQADILAAAYAGTRVFAGQAPMTNLRVVANLFSETLQVVTRPGLGIRRFDDLRGRTVSLDDPGSGTLADARIALAAHGFGEADITPRYLKPGAAAAALIEGELDAFFIVASAPTASVERVRRQVGLHLVPIAPSMARRIAAAYSFLEPATIPAGVYGLAAPVTSIGVGAQLAVRADLDATKVYGVTRALWHDATLAELGRAHRAGTQIRLNTALGSVAIPLHPGAISYYRRVGLLP